MFKQCHTCHVYGHTCHTGFSGIEKKRANLWYNPSRYNDCHSDTMIVINLLELPQPHSETFGLTQDSLKSHVQNFIAHVTQLHD